jgi:hypothetical protein
MRPTEFGADAGDPGDEKNAMFATNRMKGIIAVNRTMRRK